MEPVRTIHTHHLDSASPLGEAHVRELKDAVVIDEKRARYQPSFLLRASKRMVDISAALFFFTIFGWLFLIIAGCVFFTSGWPIFYTQPRYGKGGRIFKFYKFRSMVPNASQALEEHLKSDPAAYQQWMNFQKLENDPRITKFGRFIRKTSLDELPQFWNVLVGDMSLVGPRPCMVEQKDLYGLCWKQYCSVRPGITGLWQVSGRNMLNFQERVALDVKYVETLSVFKDLWIFIKTLWVVLSGHGSR